MGGVELLYIRERDTLIEQSYTLIEQSREIHYRTQYKELKWLF